MIALGFALLAASGALIRWWTVRWNGPIPWGTFAVNVGGAFLAGLLANAGAAAQTMLVVGGFGSLTTFSTLMVELTGTVRSASIRIGYLVATVVAGVGAAWLGLTV